MDTDIDWTEQFVQDRLYYWLNRKGHDMIVPNATRFISKEADLISVTKAGYIYEYEIKTSVRDYRADFKKEWKHQRYGEGLFLDSKNGYRRGPNRFFYAVPEGLIDPSDVPDYAGLIYVREKACFNEEVKPAPTRHREKITASQWWDLCRKLMWRYWDGRLDK